MDREVMMREAFGVREACFRFAIKPAKLSDEPYVRRGSSPLKNEVLPGCVRPPECFPDRRSAFDEGR